ncbi:MULTISPECIES: hypothetical protein [Streptomyces]|uniref:Ppx/GppA family phosphatase n=1 Tax=Streptomyces virginiae TaxID=1961 RepID=A0ABQ3NMA6_STRVG|nr:MULTISPECIES: hypothetical protein [Streptomyces]GLV94362.1 hypothetical protein Slala04_58160 [Streptomyces lavendulae subsp. lavendulae]KOU14715.1 hypothetical protein ADK49_22620 [Streptomyces sp. WM6349]KOU94082.1 hypothetical protein ADK92_23355 [Streptomyces sp. XY533]KOV40308.1 hypothetical protein ADK98_30185 [Streptomyces sp. H036]MBP2342206.1 hypothetical protein [Streptomyces virginiae]
MDDQGGAGGVPLHHGDDDEARRRAPHAGPRARKPRKDDGTTRAADTDEASRLDRPVESGGSGPDTRWTGPDDDRPAGPRRAP